MTEQPAKYFIPAARTRAELRVVNSRFIGSAAPTASVAEARAFIAEVRAELPGASHHVHAYIIGHGSSTTEGTTDDGEPSGTAGRPALAVLRGSGLGDATVVVTRYFGGSLLGTGGLVHAYGDTVKAVLAVLPHTEKIERRMVSVTLPYAAYEGACRLVAAHAGALAEKIFAADVSLRVLMPVAELDLFMAALRELTAGSAVVGDA